MTVENSARLDPRVMLAHIALATDLPTPRQIIFYGDIGPGVLALTCDRLADGQAWASYLGAPTDSRITNGVRYLKTGQLTWGGWDLHLHASEPVTVDRPLDQATTGQLHRIAQSGGEGIAVGDPL